MAQSLWGANVQVNSACEVRVLRDGSVEVRSSVQDIGTGTGTVLAQVVAEELGLRAEDVRVRIGDTDFPRAPAPAAAAPRPRSRRRRATPPTRFAGICARWPRRSWAWTPTTWRRAAAASSRAAIPRARWLPRRGGEDAHRAVRRDGFARRRLCRLPLPRGRCAAALNDLGGVQFAAVTVDTETGLVRVERVVAAHDCGRPINPAQIESQVHGGVMQGLGYALIEERMFDRQTGHIVNADLERYKMPGVLEAPQIDVLLLENYQGFSATDAYGVAEPATIPPRRRSPTPSTTRSACGCARCR